MKTYDDLLKIGENEANRMAFITEAINEHKMSEPYNIAQDAEDYDRQLNSTIMKYRKLLYTMSGEAVPDNFTANHKMASNFFHRFITQRNQYLLGNGASFQDESTKDKLGKDFDTKLQQLGRNAIVQGVGFGFWNNDHIDVFKLTEFVPLYEEETGALKAGIRFWQVSPTKPLRATLYEIDGYTDYIKQPNENINLLNKKRKYIYKVAVSVADGMQILDGRNYPSFPIVPLFANEHRQSELVGLKGEIDAYDLIKSGFANDLDDASMIYWTIENAGGMDDVDLAKFIEHMKTVKAAVVDSDGTGASASAHTLDVPYQSRETYLSRLEQDMYKDFGALDVSTISAGAKTATEINAAYQALDNATDSFEYQVIDFIDGILKLAGIDDEVSFTRSKIVNRSDEISTILQAANYLDSDYITKKVLEILGDADKAEEILDKLNEEEATRFQIKKVEEEEIEEDKEEEIEEEQ